MGRRVTGELPCLEIDDDGIWELWVAVDDEVVPSFGQESDMSWHDVLAIFRCGEDARRVVRDDLTSVEDEAMVAAPARAIPIESNALEDDAACCAGWMPYVNARWFGRELTISVGLARW